MVFRLPKKHFSSLLAVAFLVFFGSFATAQAVASTCPGADQPASVTGDSQWRKTTACLINQQRALRHKPALRLVSPLQHGAQASATSLVKEHVFNHNNLEARFKSSGYLRGYQDWGIGENILWSGANQLSPAEAVRLWLASPHHKANLLSAAWRETGLGIVRYGPAGPYGWTAVQWFGQRSR